MSDDTENDKYGSTISRKIILTNPPVNIEDKLFEIKMFKLPDGSGGFTINVHHIENYHFLLLNY